MLGMLYPCLDHLQTITSEAESAALWTVYDASRKCVKLLGLKLNWLGEERSKKRCGRFPHELGISTFQFTLCGTCQVVMFLCTSADRVGKKKRGCFSTFMEHRRCREYRATSVLEPPTPGIGIAPAGRRSNVGTPLPFPP